MNSTPHPVRKRLGDVLKAKKRVTEPELARLMEQAPQGARLGEMLLDRGLISKEEVVEALQEVMGCSYLDARFVTVDPKVLPLIPRSTAIRNGVLPLAQVGRQLVVLMAEPQNLRLLDELRFIAGLEISPRLGIQSEILTAIERCYESVEETEADGDASQIAVMDLSDAPDMQFVASNTDERNSAAMEELAAEMRNEKTPAVKLASAILAAAVAKKASDLHIEPRDDSTLVRIRVDGNLRDLTIVPKELTLSLISRLKILANLDISDRRTPQDGRFQVQFGKNRLDLRVSTLPMHEGEKVVMRLLDPSSARVDFTQLGFTDENARIFRHLVSQPQGMILVTGPTGSGKSTTLYSALNLVTAPNLNIVTVEDPVEFKIREINQVQINAKAGLTFAQCLRSILRQDPNVIMVGEIRDTETAEIALQAAQTGHLVLSSLHTNDALSAVSRLADLKIANFLIASSVSCVIAQRLVRKLCFCRTDAPIRQEYAARMKAAGISDLGDKMFVPAGCSACDNSGYKGRVAVYEMLVFNEQIRAAVRNGSHDKEILALARSNGMKLMTEDGLDKVRLGLTTVEEIARVVGFPEAETLRCTHCAKTVAPADRFCPACGASVQPSGPATHAPAPYAVPGQRSSTYVV